MLTSYRHDTSELPTIQLDRAVTRNAELIVALRHAAAARHGHAPGHSRAVSWTTCNHDDCRKVQALLELRPAPKSVREN